MRCAAAFFAWRGFYTLWDGAAWQIRPVFTKRDCFWQNREFSTNKLGLLTIYKSVIVPNTDNMKGLEAAAAAGIVAGKQEKKLEVIADVTPEQTKAIRAYLDQTDIKVRHVENGVTFDIILTVWKGEHSAQVRIAVFHTNIVHVEKDGEVLVDIPVHGDDEETLTDRTGDDIHEADTRQELMSLSARFGLTVTFQRPEKARFEVILTELAKQHGIEMPHDELLTKAEAFAIRAGGRSPRVAKQFIEQCAAGVQK